MSEKTPIVPEKVEEKSQFWVVEPRLLRIKVFYFFRGGTWGSVFPFMTLYFKQLGFSTSAIGIVASLRPFVAISSALLIGSLADHFRVRRVCLLLALACAATAITTMGFVPPAHIRNSTCPPELNNSSNPIAGSSELRKNLAPIDDTRILLNTSRAGHGNATNTGNATEDFSDFLEDRGWMFRTSELNTLFCVIIALDMLSHAALAPSGVLLEVGCLSELVPHIVDKLGRQIAWSSIGDAIM